MIVLSAVPNVIEYAIRLSELSQTLLPSGRDTSLFCNDPAMTSHCLMSGLTPEALWPMNTPTDAIAAAAQNPAANLSARCLAVEVRLALSMALALRMVSRQACLISFSSTDEPSIESQSLKGTFISLVVLTI